ncbi:MAG: hypothetical protein K0Q79_2005 [Flavipsychrobacter sp.]|jgi:hypothetical protein|nr:hypothetical protein [Flavipsychrobacter sp.]
MKSAILLLTLIIIISISTNVYAQNWAWAKSSAGYGDITLGRVATDATSNVIVCGESYIAKYNSSGSLLWKKDATSGFGGGARDVCTDASGNIYVAGFFTGTATFGSTTLTSAGNDDIFLAKYDNSGGVVWAKSAGGASNDNASSVAVNAAGDIYICGSFSSTSISFGSTTLSNTGSGSMFIAKYNSSGSVTWARAASSGTFSCGAASIAADNSGNVWITGNFNGTTITLGTVTVSNVASPYPDMFIAKYDATGSVLWAKGGGSDYYDGPWEVTVDAAGNSYVVGTFTGDSMYVGSVALPNTLTGGMDAFVVSYNASGGARWAKSIGNTGYDEIVAAAVDSGGNLYVAGAYNGSTFVFGPTTLTNAGDWDIVIAKYNTSGVEQWATKVGGSDNDGVDGIALDNAGAIYVSGSFLSPTLTFGSTALTYSGGFNRDNFIAKMHKPSGVPGIKKQPLYFSIYPNPANDELIVTAKELITDIAIIDLYGKRILQNEYVAKEVHINTSGIAAGVYTLVINGTEAKNFVKR